MVSAVNVQSLSRFCQVMHTARSQSADAGNVGNEDALRGVFNAPKPVGGEFAA